MKIALTISERVGAYIIFSEVKQGPRSFMNIIRDARKTIEIKPEDVKEYGITGRPDGGIDWLKEKSDQTKEFVLTEGAHNYLKSRLKELDKEEKIHVDMLDIANKILGAGKKKG